MKAHYFFITSILTFAWLAISAAGISQEGYVFPVTSELTIVDVELSPDLPGYSIVTGNFEKYRECNKLEITWYYTDHLSLNSYNKVRVIAFESGAPTVNNLGENELKLFYVNIHPSLLKDRSYATITHDCYNSWLWNTTNTFYTTE